MLEHRRAVRYYDASKPIDADRVKECVRLATLAPTSSNMQLWEAYHVTDRATIDRLVPACMGQSAVKTGAAVGGVCRASRPVEGACRKRVGRQRGECPQDLPGSEVGKVCRSATSVLSKDRSFPLFSLFRRLGTVSQGDCERDGLFSPHRSPSDGERYAGRTAQELCTGGADLYVGDERSGLRYLSARRFRFRSREEGARFALCGAREHDRVLRRSR